MKSVARRLALLTCMLVSPVTAQVTIPQEYDKTIKSAEVVGALGNALFGDDTNLYTGATSFTVTDVDVPGTDSLSVAVGRRFVIEDRGDLKTPGLFADWELEIPHLHGTFAKTGPSDSGWKVSTSQQPYARCSVSSDLTAMPPTVSGAQGGLFDSGEYWHGNSLYVPGQGAQEMLVVTPNNPHRPTDGASYRWVTNNQWYFSCLPATANGFSGEGFLARAPDGTRYRFDWMVKRPAGAITKEVGGGPLDAAATSQTSSHSTMMATSSILQREEIWILPTRVEDRFGNFVVYAYDSANPWRLTSISASDGRLVSLTYNAAGDVDSVSTAARTWTYTYTNGYLSQVLLPDASEWQLSLANLVEAGITQMGAGSQGESFFCETRTSTTSQPTHAGTMTHPSGAIGTFAVRGTLHGRSHVAKQCVWPGGVGGKSNYAMHPFLFDTLALQAKTIAGPGMATARWTFTYGVPNNSWSVNCTGGCATTKTVETVSPGGVYTRHTFGNRYKENEGQLLLVETGTSSTNLLRAEQTTYLLDAANQNFPAQVGLSPYSRGDRSAERLRPAIVRETRQQGRHFTWQVDTDCTDGLCLDMFARPTKVTKSSAPAP